MDSTISIIVPIYNAENYLDRCIESIINQTYQNLEIILIDDGSIDKSGEICDHYATKDLRVRVFHQMNKGIGLTRQFGIDISTGDYVVWVDADDWVDKNEIEDMYSVAITNHSEIVICDYYSEESEKTILVKQDFGVLDKKYVIEHIINYSHMGPYLWNKMFRRDIISNHHITFSPYMSYGEDVLFLCRFLKFCKTISYLPQAYYHYNNVNTNSVTSSMSEYIVDSHDKLFSIWEKEFNEYLLEEEKYYYKKRYLQMAFSIKKYNKLKRYQEVHARIIEECKYYDSPSLRYLTMALNGHPHLAHFLYRMSMLRLTVQNKIKTVLCNK